MTGNRTRLPAGRKAEARIFSASIRGGNNLRCMLDTLFIRHSCFVFFFCFFFSFTAFGSAVTEKPAAATVPVSQNEIMSKRIVSKLLHSHYLNIDTDSQFSSKVLNRYLNELDEYHQFFLQSEVLMFQSTYSSLAGDVRAGKLDNAFIIASKAQSEKNKFYDFVLNRIKTPISVERGDFIGSDRSDSSWPENDNARTALWDKMVTDELIRLMVSGRTREEAVKIISARYLRLKSYLTRNNDAFSTIINAFLKAVDPHARYLTADDSTSFETSMTLHLSGIGVSLRQADDYSTEVAGVTQGGPADKSGKIMPGDRLLWIQSDDRGETDVSDYLIDEISGLIKGEAGSVVRLGLKSRTGDYRKVTLRRAIIEQDELQARVLKENFRGNKIALVTVPSFYQGVADDVDKGLFDIENDVDVIVINLMNNGGGSLTEAVQLSNLFVGAGPVVQVRSSSMTKARILGSDFSENYKLPIVVLVNSASASASEIFAAALQDYGVAVIVGERTFGKGTVQERHSLSRIYDSKRYPDWPSPGSLIYTIQKFYRVNGESTQITGVLPDISLPLGGERTGERFEYGALPWDAVAPASYKPEEKLKKIIPALRQKSLERLSRNQHGRCVKDLTQRMHEEEDTTFLSLSLTKRRAMTDSDKRTGESCLTGDNISNKGVGATNGVVVRYALEEAENIAADLSEQLKLAS